MPSLTMEEQRLLFFTKSRPFALDREQEQPSLPKNVGRLTLSQYTLSKYYTSPPIVAVPSMDCILFPLLDDISSSNHGISPLMYTIFLDHEDFHVFREMQDPESDVNRPVSFTARTPTQDKTETPTTPKIAAVPGPVSDEEPSSGSEKASKNKNGSLSSLSSVSGGHASSPSQPASRKKGSPRRAVFKVKQLPGFAIFDPPTDNEIKLYGDNLSIDELKPQMQPVPQPTKDNLHVGFEEEAPEVVACEARTPQTPSPLRLAAKKNQRPDSPTLPRSAKLTGRGKTYNPSLLLIKATPPTSPSKEQISSPPVSPFVRPKNPTPSKARSRGKGFVPNLSPVAPSPALSPVVDNEEVASTSSAPIPFALPAITPSEVSVNETETKIRETLEAPAPAEIPVVELNGAILNAAEDAEDSSNNSGLEIVTGDENAKLGWQAPLPVIATVQVPVLTQPVVQAPVVQTTEGSPIPEEQEVKVTALGALMTIAASFILAKSLKVAPKTTAVIAGLGAVWYFARKNL